MRATVQTLGTLGSGVLFMYAGFAVGLPVALVAVWLIGVAACGLARWEL